MSIELRAFCLIISVGLVVIDNDGQCDSLNKVQAHAFADSELAKLYRNFEEKYGITEGKSYSLNQIQSSLADDAAF